METVYQEKDHILSVLAQNHTGVLQRISGLFSRRCYNILSIVAAQTADAGLSEVLIVVTGDGRIVKQVKRQLEKLVDVERVTVLDREKSVVREHVLLKVARTKENSESLVAVANTFHAGILSVTDHSMLVELTGDPRTLDSFVELYQPYGILKVLRTGTMAIQVEEDEA